MIDELKSAITQKDRHKATTLISANPSLLDERDEKGSSGFMLLAYAGMADVFNGAKELKQTYSFHEAIVAGKISFIKEYTESELSTLSNEYSDDGFTPLSLAAYFDQTEIAMLLIEYGANPNLKATNPSKVNALHSAVAKENFELCQLLITNGADINAVQTQNVTALQSAAHRGDLKLVQLLVENGADVNMKMDNGESAISLARNEGHEKVVDYLTNQG